MDRARLVSEHDAPHDSLFFGTAGTAYACWRVGRRLGSAALVETAGALIAQAGASFADETIGLSAEACAPSLFFGPAGVAWVRALIVGGDAADALDGDGACPALLDGAAGRLLAASALGRRASVDRLAGALVGSGPWSLDRSGVAHGNAGLYLALLLAHAPLPAWFFPALEEVGPDREDGTWCRGLGGIVLLHVHAFRASGAARWLSRARAEADLLVARAGGPPDLCCGAAGAAYALCALDAVDPGGGWRDRAVDLALRSITSETASRWPHALFRGDAGLLCLAVDLLEGGAAGFPCLED
jgi:hypothetical protein